MGKKTAIFAGLLCAICFAVAGGLLGRIFTQGPSDELFTASMVFWTIGGGIFLFWVVHLALYLSRRNHKRIVQWSTANASPNAMHLTGLHDSGVRQDMAATYTSGFSKWWPICFGTLSLVLLATGGGMLISFYNKASSFGEDDSSFWSYYWDGGGYNYKVGGIVCLGLGGLLAFLWLVFLIIYCVRKRPVAPIYLVASAPVQMMPLAQGQGE